MPPQLTDKQVEQFVALGENGWERYKAGDLDGAEVSFSGQIRLFAGNPEPHVSLALLAATRGNDDEAIAHLRSAVIRGFDDLPRVARSEVWGTLTGHAGYRELINAAIEIRRFDARWPRWGDFVSTRPPENVEAVLDARRMAVERIDAMAPAIGVPQTKRWTRMTDRVMAARLEAYIEERAGADDAGRAVDELLALYTGRALRRWQRLTPDVAERLRTVADLVLGPVDAEAGPAPRTVSDTHRPAALMAAALGYWMDRDRKGRVYEDSLERVDAALDELLTDHADSELAPVAAVAAVLTARSLGDDARARAAFASFVDRSADAPERLERFRESLGETALLYGGLPRFSGPTLDGATCSDDTLDGRVAVIDFWATWCGPCLEGFDTLRTIDERFGERVALVGVNLDDPAQVPGDGLDRWVAEQRVPGIQIHDGLAWESALVRAFGVSEIPFTVVVDPAGEVVAVNRHGKQLVRTVASALK